ncbi:alpha-(1,3)-fucosyltransferase fut-6-like isoform X2 [Ruditapes philippinarum]|uniref:alpha-(1,3)-fucosyltransferase fut-6-like isoform X2 n=1 Tax=Ruditapes philippinarum TaxID=129788 RepID=UPI00295B4BC5|nr:alpha-(1,3)-fucosyltransferase fut-6-like isoform X2 [Ruditapes philippinarum]
MNELVNMRDKNIHTRTIGSYKVIGENPYFKEKPVKIILYWTTLFRKQTPIDKHRKCLSTCEAKCIVTDDKTQIENADAVEFHLSDIWTQIWRIGTKSIVEFPNYRRPDQVWILANKEPPPHLWGDIQIFNGLFNWTRWYRTDSDVWLPYGVVHPYNETEQAEVAYKLKNRNFYKEKTKGIALTISNCFDAGRRYQIIKELNKFIDIDKYGKCYNRVCGDTAHQDDQSCGRLLRNYKFYIAFENNFCKDYITEKYWMALEREQIPIVNWKYFSPSVVVPNSYINIFDFDTIQQLAQYLKLVSSNETLYNSYLEHKQFYTDRRDMCDACSVCHALHDKDRPAQVYTDIEGWVREDSCEKVNHWNHFLKNIYAQRFQILGF